MSTTTRRTKRSELAHTLRQFHLKGEYKKYSAGQILFEENTEALGCYVIQSGNVELSVRCFDGSRIAVEHVRTGDMIGVSAGFADRRYVSTACALSDTETFYISSEEIIRSLQVHPKTRILILSALSRSARRAIRYFVAKYAGPERRRLVPGQDISEYPSCPAVPFCARKKVSRNP